MTAKAIMGNGLLCFLLSLIYLALPCPLPAQNNIVAVDEGELQIMADSFKLKISENGRAIGHSTAWEITMPPQFSDRKLNYVRVHFCKDPQYLQLNEHRIDENGAYLSLNCHNPVDGTWHQWSDQFGPEKFATVGDRHKLNRNVFNSIQSLVGEFPVDKIRLINTGRGKTELAIAHIYYLECFFLAEASSVNLCSQSINAVWQNSTTARFVFDDAVGRPFKRGEKWCLQLPQELAGRQINYIIMRFRQSADKIVDDNSRDQSPAYILVEAQDIASGLLWPWYDRYGTEKYVEPRSADDPENENLHDCLNCMNGVAADKIVLTNTGYGDPDRSIALMYSVEVVFFPDHANTCARELIYTRNTRFADPVQKKILPEFGGGPRFGGQYPGALMLGVRRCFREIYQKGIPQEHRFETSKPAAEDGFIDGLGRLFLYLPAGKKLRQVELAAGDVDNTVLETNKDAHFGRLGWSELYLYIKNGNDQKLRLLARKVNVGPEGIIAVTPDCGDYEIMSGDQLVIESRLDVAYIMGVRLLFRLRTSSTRARPSENGHILAKRPRIWKGRCPSGVM